VRPPDGPLLADETLPDGTLAEETLPADGALLPDETPPAAAIVPSAGVRPPFAAALAAGVRAAGVGPGRTEPAAGPGVRALAASSAKLGSP
jgi:hypothetical protein